MANKRSGSLREWFSITAGILIMTVGIYFFKFPNHFSTGGVTGIAIILGHYLPAVTPGTLVTIINIALLILGFAVLGKSFGIRTVYASLLMSGTLQLLEILCPMRAPMTTQPLVELLFAVGLPAAGSRSVYHHYLQHRDHRKRFSRDQLNDSAETFPDHGIFICKTDPDAEANPTVLPDAPARTGSRDPGAR